MGKFIIKVMKMKYKGLKKRKPVHSPGGEWRIQTGCGDYSF